MLTLGVLLAMWVLYWALFRGAAALYTTLGKKLAEKSGFWSSAAEAFELIAGFCHMLANTLSYPARALCRLIRRMT